VLFAGSAQGKLPLSNGCILWVDPVLPLATLPLAGRNPGEGSVTVTGRLPLRVPPGTVVTLQTLIADPGADGGVSSTSAFQLTVL
jgi:hypothetical protein